MRILKLLILLTLSFLCCLNAEDKKEKMTPEALVASLYKTHEADLASIFNQTENRKPLDHYFTKELADLIWKDALEANGEVGLIGADPLFNAQDTEITDFALKPRSVETSKAEVEATFKNFAEKQTIIFKLEQTAGEWKIADICYTQDLSLLKILKEGQGN